MKNKVAICTLGCKVNTYDSEVIIQEFIDNDYDIVQFEDTADIYIINTCTVTNTADSKSKKMINRAKHKNNDAIVVVTGCLAQVNSDEISNLQIDIITGTTDRKNIVNLVKEFQQNNKKITNIAKQETSQKFENSNLVNMHDKTRAFLKIQDGCNQYCSYCIIPTARGNIRSKKQEDVLFDIKELTKKGYKEIVLTGIHLSSYGVDINTTLLNLLKEIEMIEELEVVRLGSIEQSIITKDFIKFYKTSKKLAHHFHLSFQSGSDQILKAMNRKYSVEEFKEKVNMLRQINSNCSITTDIIVGFPGETEELFIQTVNSIKAINFSSVHFFRFSPKKNTKASVMNFQIIEKTKKDRVDILQEIQNKIEINYLNEFIDKELFIIKEDSKSRTTTKGISKYYFKVKINSYSDSLKNHVKINGLDIKNKELIGEFIK